MKDKGELYEYNNFSLKFIIMSVPGTCWSFGMFIIINKIECTREQFTVFNLLTYICFDSTLTRFVYKIILSNESFIRSFFYFAFWSTFHWIRCIVLIFVLQYQISDSKWRFPRNAVLIGVFAEIPYYWMIVITKESYCWTANEWKTYIYSSFNSANILLIFFFFGFKWIRTRYLSQFRLPLTNIWNAALATGDHFDNE